jgi:hypothetical protein
MDMRAQSTTAQQKQRILGARDHAGIRPASPVLAVAWLCFFLSGCGSITNLNRTVEESSAPKTATERIRAAGSDDSPYAISAKRQTGHGISFDVFGARKEKESVQTPATDDPEYAEYLEWKRWQEFKAYQEWKVQQEALKSS